MSLHDQIMECCAEINAIVKEIKATTDTFQLVALSSQLRASAEKLRELARLPA